MFRTNLIIVTSVLGSVACAVTGCGRIAVAPTCPQNLAVGESGPAATNPTDPGAVPTYQWEVVPSTAGTFSDPTAANTTFTAEKEGTATLRITASDSIFLAVGQCQVVVAATSGVQVSLTADVSQPVVGDTVTLTCESIGATAAVSTSFQQTDGTAAELTPIGGGRATFVPAEAGDFAFSCTGLSPGGAASEPADLTVTVSASTGGGRPPRR